MYIKNRIIELFPSNIKEILYTAIKDNKNIMYTRNGRSTPIRTKTGIENVYIIETSNKLIDYTIVVEPDKQQLEYFDYKILDIKTSIEADMEILELKSFLQDNSKIEFITAIDSSNFNFSSQYENEIVYQYILRA